MGFLIGGKATYTDSLSNLNIDAKTLYEKNNLTGVVGFGVHQYGFPKFALTHGLRFTYGFDDIVKTVMSEPALGKPTNTLTIGYIMAITFKFPSER